MNCAECGSSLAHYHKLIDNTVSPMKNKSKIIYPKCSVCGHPIQVPEIEENISASRKVLLISGTAGAGKSSLGQLIESISDYTFIDGDAISKRVNHHARLDPSAVVPDYQMETIRTMLVLLGLGYDVVVGYVINQEVLRWYREGLANYQITPVFRTLVPERSVCLQRDMDRECWTAGAEYVDRWYDEQRAYLITDPECCIDSSQETLVDTFANHLAMNPSGHKWLEKNILHKDGFWSAVDMLVDQSEIVIDRPQGTKHPRFDFIYPLDYGYLKDTISPDGGCIDVWYGSLSEPVCDAVICTIDLLKKDSEIKILIGCSEEEKAVIMHFHNDCEYMKGTMIRRESEAKI